jgi:hypothetical protein
VQRSRLMVVPMALALALTACGGSSKPAAPTSPPTTDPAAAKAAISSAWIQLFNSKLTSDQRLAGVEDGANLSTVLASFASLASNTSATVSTVDLLVDPDCSSELVTSPCAKVTYSILINNAASPVTNATGFAVLVNGHWVVSKATFCALAALAPNAKPSAACSAGTTTTA